VKQIAKNKGVEVDVDRLLEVDKKRREQLQALEDMRAKKNKASDQIVSAKPARKETLIYRCGNRYE
jgi:seryl-tRNA synthetase